MINIAQEKNIIVILPTGAGKTLIVAELIRRRQTNSTKPSIFFVPTCMLVVQQAAAIREWTHLNVGEYMGGLKFPDNFDVLVTTPKAFEIKQKFKNDTLNWSIFDLVAFDECHHVLKDHP